MKQNMQKNTKLKIYISPTVKMVSFTVERGFDGTNTNDVKAEEARVYGDGNQVTGWNRDLSSDNN
jgi:hypothetical protein